VYGAPDPSVPVSAPASDVPLDTSSVGCVQLGKAKKLIESDADAVCAIASVTRIVKLPTPAVAMGFTEIAPVDADSTAPGGNNPAILLNENGAVPPLTDAPLDEYASPT